MINQILTNRKSFIRCQIVSLLATAIDFLTSVIIFRIIGCKDLTSTLIGGSIGALFSFILGRRWAFQSTQSRVRDQLVRFTIANVGNIGLNIWGVFITRHYFGIPFEWSRIIVSIFVGVTYNYTVSRHFVFK